MGRDSGACIAHRPPNPRAAGSPASAIRLSRPVAPLLLRAAILIPNAVLLTLGARGHGHENMTRRPGRLQQMALVRWEDGETCHLYAPVGRAAPAGRLQLGGCGPESAWKTSTRQLLAECGGASTGPPSPPARAAEACPGPVRRRHVRPRAGCGPAPASKREEQCSKVHVVVRAVKGPGWGDRGRDSAQMTCARMTRRPEPATRFEEEQQVQQPWGRKALALGLEGARAARETVGDQRGPGLCQQGEG